MVQGPWPVTTGFVRCSSQWVNTGKKSILCFIAGVTTFASQEMVKFTMIPNMVGLKEDRLDCYSTFLHTPLLKHRLQGLVHFQNDGQRKP